MEKPKITMHNEINYISKYVNNGLRRIDKMEANSYLLKTIYSRWHGHNMLHYSYIKTDSAVHMSGTDISSHSLIPETPSHMLYIIIII